MANGNNQFRDVPEQFFTGEGEQRQLSLLTPEEMESAQQLMGLDPGLLEASFGQAARAHEQIFGTPSEFSEQEYQELVRLTGRHQQLSQPLHRPEPIGGHIPGNEFSLSVRGLHQGASDLVHGFQEARRQRELFGDHAQQNKIRKEIGNLTEQADKLRDDAQLVRTGQPTPSMQQFMPEGAEPIDDERIANLMMLQADQLEEDALALRDTLQEHTGVDERLRDAQRRAQAAGEDRDFQHEFIRVFGQQAYDSTVEQMQEVAQLERTRETDARRHMLTMDRVRYQEQQRNNRAILSARSRMRVEDPDIPTGVQITPLEYRPKRIKIQVEEYIRENEAHMERVIEELTNDGMMNISQLPQEQQREIERMRNRLLHFRQIATAADVWEHDMEALEPEEGDLPEPYYPTPSQISYINNLRYYGIPSQFIDAWKFYNNVSFDGKRALPPGVSDEDEAVMDSEQAPDAEQTGVGFDLFEE